MTASIVNHAAQVTPPVSGGDGLVVLASSATAATFQIPDEWLDGWICIQADGVDVSVAFTEDSALVADPTDVTTLASGAIDTHGTAEVRKVFDGTEKPYDLSLLPRLPAGSSWYLAHVESGAGGYVRLEKASGAVIRP